MDPYTELRAHFKGIAFMLVPIAFVLIYFSFR